MISMEHGACMEMAEEMPPMKNLSAKASVPFRETSGRGSMAGIDRLSMTATSRTSVFSGKVRAATADTAAKESARPELGQSLGFLNRLIKVAMESLAESVVESVPFPRLLGGCEIHPGGVKAEDDPLSIGRQASSAQVMEGSVRRNANTNTDPFSIARRGFDF
jgi:hypothetical protein